MDYRILKLKNHISNNIQKKLEVKELAKTIGLSGGHLTKLFKQETGVSIKFFIKEQRLNKAKDLLENSDKTIKQIIFEIGVGEQTHFFYDFKKQFGVTPKEYRQKYWNTLLIEVDEIS